MKIARFLIIISLCLTLNVVISAQTDVKHDLICQWTFDNGTNKDLVLNGAKIYNLGGDQNCLQFPPKAGPAALNVKPDMVFQSGTISFWVNASTTDNYNLIDFDNGAVTLRSYRGYLQPRFTGEDKFKVSGSLLNDQWYKHLMREDAFYPHHNALLEENVWHHFVVTYDYKNDQYIGWRDGKLIAVIDLSGTGMEPLKTEDLNKILIGEDFIGFIDDIRLYNSVLSNDDVASIYASTKKLYENRHDFIKPDRKLNVYEYKPSDKVLYNAWLTYSDFDVKSDPDLFKQIIIQSNNSTIYTAAKELQKAVIGLTDILIPITQNDSAKGNILLGTPDESGLIEAMADELGLNRVKDDGFVLKSIISGGKSFLVVAANEPAGVIFGTFKLIEKIKLKENLADLDFISNPKVKIRIVGHWDWFRGTEGDDWHGKSINPYKWESNRYNSIYSWEDIRNGTTKHIEEWARFMASAGWNAICPTEINWQEQNNFLNHMDEVVVLAQIFRNYGIKLYWTPNYLLALKKSTADTLYKRIPDFGGYLLKLGSEGQLGNPFPEMVNNIAKNLAPYNGEALVRGFVYGKHRYAHLTEVYRNTMQYDIYKPNDGKYLNNVTIVGKANPLDWDLAAPISPLDGAIQKTSYGTEMVIAKSWPASWLEKWKWWMDYDNYHNGKGSYNKNYIKCLLGVSMISPAPAWTSNPLNMVNYYGLGRLAWNPDLSVEDIYDEWIGLTYGPDPEVHKIVKNILFKSDDVLKNQYIYRGYRGVWFDTSEDDLVENKTTHIMTKEGIGILSTEAEQKVLNQYSPELQEIFNDPLKGEEFLPYFHFVKYDYKLSNGRTLIQDMFMNLDDAVSGAKKMLEEWNGLQGDINDKSYEYTKDNLVEYINTVKDNREKMIRIIERISGRNYETETGSK